MSPSQINEASEISRDLERREHHSDRLRAAVGLGFVGLGMAASGALLLGSLDDERFEQTMSFNERAQDAVNNVDDVLATAGAIALPLSLAGIGAVKLGAMRSNRLRSMDKRSSQELSDDGHGNANLARRALRTVAAGSVPVVVGASAAVGALTAGIGTEITDGPSRPITSLDQFANGDTMITQYESAMPMLESKLTSYIVDAVQAEAAERGIDTTSVSIGLNSLVYEGSALTGLTLGVEESKLPEVLHNNSCSDVSVLVDKVADIPTGSQLTINGLPTTVVGQVENVSATNRIGVVMEQGNLEQCVNKNAEIQSHAVIMDTDVKTAQEILTTVNIENETTAVITKDQYIENSQDFWESNVKPITNTLALVGLMTSFIAMGGSAVSRMLRNRRELAAKLAAGESVNHFRATELIRAAKDGVLGSTVGVTAAAALTVPVNALESGMRAGLGVKEVMVGYAVGILGTMGGTLLHVIRPNKVVDPSEHTRV